MKQIYFFSLLRGQTDRQRDIRERESGVKIKKKWEKLRGGEDGRRESRIKKEKETDRNEERRWRRKKTVEGRGLGKRKEVREAKTGREIW